MSSPTNSVQRSVQDHVLRQLYCGVSGIPAGAWGSHLDSWHRSCGHVHAAITSHLTLRQEVIGRRRV